MDAVAFYPQSLVSFNKQLKLGKPVFSPREIADWPSPFAFQKNPHKLTIVSRRSDGSRRGRTPQKGSAAGRTKKGDGNITQFSDGKVSSSSNQEEIIALFKRIQSSISKGESVSMKKRNSISSQGKHTVESVVDALLHTRKEVKGTSSIKDGEVQEQEIQNNGLAADFKLTRLPSNFVKRSPIPSPSAPGGKVLEQEIQSNGPVADFKLTRLPSNFVKRSPIPSPSAPSAPRGKVLELNNEASANTAKSEQLKLPRVEELKLPQLKELAKARGLKGYSRLKKSELVKLLRS